MKNLKYIVFFLLIACNNKNTPLSSHDVSPHVNQADFWEVRPQDKKTGKMLNETVSFQKLSPSLAEHLSGRLQEGVNLVAYCNLEEKPYYKVVHKGFDNIRFEELDRPECKRTVEKTPIWDHVVLSLEATKVYNFWMDYVSTEQPHSELRGHTISHFKQDIQKVQGDFEVLFSSPSVVPTGDKITIGKPISGLGGKEHGEVNFQYLKFQLSKQ